MLPLKKILVTTDFSTLSHEGMKVARKWPLPTPRS